MNTGGIRIITPSLSQSVADGRYVRRLVTIAGAPVLAGETWAQVNQAGTTEPVLGNPNGPVQGAVPINASATLLGNGDGARFGTRVRAIRIGNQAVFTGMRANGSFQAPTAVAINEGVAGLFANAYGSAGTFLNMAAVSIISREAVTGTAAGGEVQILASNLGTQDLQTVAGFRSGAALIAEIVARQPTLRIIAGSTLSSLRNGTNTADMLSWNNTGLGFYGTAPIAKPTATGSRGGNAALASLLTQLANLGLITDSTTA